MTSKSTFDKLAAFIKEEGITVEVNDTFYNEIREESWFPNGTAGDDGYIILYKKPKDNCWNMLTSLLIHEFGHICCWDMDFEHHTEYDAWVHGIDNVPKQYWPSTLKEDYRLCLRSFGFSDMKIDNIDKIVDDYLNETPVEA